LPGLDLIIVENAVNGLDRVAVQRRVHRLVRFADAVWADAEEVIANTRFERGGSAPGINHNSGKFISLRQDFVAFRDRCLAT
jgi:hypothetical protein